MRQAVSRTQMWGPGTYASLRLKLDAWSSAVQRGQKCSSPTRRLPSRSWGPIRPRVCSWFRAPIRHECQTAQLKSRGGCHIFVAASHQTRLDTRSKARRPIKVGIKGRGRSGRSRDSNPACPVLLIGSPSAMWAWWGKQFHEPKCESGHVCQFTA